MFVSLENLRFPIPFKQINSGQLQLIERIDTCRKNGRQLIGEAKISDRQTTIILSYLITALLRPNTYIFGNQPTQENKRDQDLLKSVVYLCKGENRKKWLIQLAEKVHKFVLKALSSDDLNSFSLEVQPEVYNGTILKFYQGSHQDQRNHEQMQKICKENGYTFKRIYFLRTQKFLQFKLRKRQDATWKKPYQFGCQTDFFFDNIGYISKRADYLFIETNDLQGILGELITIDLFQIHLNRAFIEFKKLNKYYNFRLEERKNKKETSSRHSSKRDLDLAQDFGHSDKIMENFKQELEKNLDLEMKIEQKKVQWNVSDYDRKFNELYKQKKQTLITAKVGYVQNTSSVPQEYQDCYYLMNLQIIGFVLSFLLVEWRTNQFQQSHQNLNMFLNYIHQKTFIRPSYLKKLRRIFLSFMHKHPPKLSNQALSYVYIDQVFLFFQKATIWNEIFCKASSIQQSIGSSDNTNFGARFVVFRQKPNKDSNLRLTSYDQKILFQILAENSKNFNIFQNLAVSFDYYEKIFRPSISQIKDLLFQYRCPKLIGHLSKNMINGFIVSSTPNQEDLHLSNQKQESSTIQSLEDKKIDKDHYSQIVRAYGVLVHDICQQMPDGVIVYFPTRNLLKQCRSQWQSKQNIYERINQIKKIFEQDQWQKNNILNIYSFKKRCRAGRGAVFFLSAQSQFSKNQCFYSLYSRCIIFIGVPYHPFPLQTKQKLEFLKLKQQYHFDQGMKNVSRCLSNCINSCDELKTVVFADISYNRTDLQSKWFPFIREGNLNTLQVLDWIILINKSETFLIKKQKQQQAKRKKEQAERKLEDKLDILRRASNSNLPIDY